MRYNVEILVNLRVEKLHLTIDDCSTADQPSRALGGPLRSVSQLDCQLTGPGDAGRYRARNTPMSDELEHITDLQHVRERPAMYFGDLDAPTIPNCLAREAYCLAIDQIVAGTCTQLTTDITSDGFASVAHNGTALGIEPESRFPDMSEMQVVAELIGFCADRAASEYVHSHVCKNGMTALNALCERFELHNFTDGSHYLLAYNCGEREMTLQYLGSTTETGVSIRFKPDRKMVTYTQFDLVELAQWFSSIPIETDNVDIQWNDHRDANAR